MRILLTSKSLEFIRSDLKKESLKEPFTGVQSPNTKKEESKLEGSFDSKQINNSKIIKRTGPSVRVSSKKYVEVNQKRINLPNVIYKKYSITKPVEKQNATLLPALPKDLIQKVKKSPNNSSVEDSHADLSMSQEENGLDYDFPLREIISKESVIDLKKDIYKHLNIDHTKNLRDANARSNYERKDVIGDLDKKINKVNINSSKINLIQYLNKKKKISEVLINKLANYDEDQIIRLNKVCQKIVDKAKEDEKFELIVKEKLDNNQKRIKVETHFMFNNLDDYFKRINKVSDAYDTKLYSNYRKAYIKERHTNLKRNFWENPFIEKITRIQEKKLMGVGKTVSRVNSQLLLPKREVKFDI